MKSNKKIDKKENFADTTNSSSTLKTIGLIALTLGSIGIIVGLIYFINSQKLDIDLTRGFKSNF